jgi:hypothetical protein
MFAYSFQDGVPGRVPVEKLKSVAWRREMLGQYREFASHTW